MSLRLYTGQHYSFEEREVLLEEIIRLSALYSSQRILVQLWSPEAESLFHEKAPKIDTKPQGRYEIVLQSMQTNRYQLYLSGGYYLTPSYLTPGELRQSAEFLLPGGYIIYLENPTFKLPQALPSSTDLRLSPYLSEILEKWRLRGFWSPLYFLFLLMVDVYGPNYFKSPLPEPNDTAGDYAWRRLTYRERYRDLVGETSGETLLNLAKKFLPVVTDPLRGKTNLMEGFNNFKLVQVSNIYQELAQEAKGDDDHSIWISELKEVYPIIKLRDEEEWFNSVTGQEVLLSDEIPTQPTNQAIESYISLLSVPGEAYEMAILYFPTF